MYCLIERLNSLCEFLDYSFDINCGGCCLIARYIAEHLDNLNIKYDLIIFDSDERDNDAVVQQVQNNEKNIDSNSVIGYTTCNHYCIEINNSLINCPNKYDENDYYKFRIPNIKWDNIDWIYDNGNWNDTYESKKYSKAIKSIIDNFFSIYENKIDKLN